MPKPQKRGRESEFWDLALLETSRIAEILYHKQHYFTKNEICDFQVKFAISC